MRTLLNVGLLGLVIISVGIVWANNDWKLPTIDLFRKEDPEEELSEAETAYLEDLETKLLNMHTSAETFGDLINILIQNPNVVSRADFRDLLTSHSRIIELTWEYLRVADPPESYADLHSEAVDLTENCKDYAEFTILALNSEDTLEIQDNIAVAREAFTLCGDNYTAVMDAVDEATGENNDEEED